MKAAIRIYTDGACEPNPGPGAWGAYWNDRNGEEIELCGFEAGTTNQRMEMMGAIVALETIEERGSILVLSDSKYVVNGITKVDQGVEAQRMADQGKDAGQEPRLVGTARRRDNRSRRVSVDPRPCRRSR